MSVSAGAVGLATIVLGAPIMAAFVVRVVSAFIPVAYLFVHYKSLERRGALYSTSITLIDPLRDLIGAGFARLEPEDMIGPAKSVCVLG
jgi:hypothetical protein